MARSGARLRDIPWGNALSGRWWWRQFNKRLIQTGRLTALLALVGLVFIRISDPQIVQFLRTRAFDFYQQLKPRAIEGESPVVIVDIDEKSLAELQAFPWPRYLFAKMIDNLTAAETGPIGFDIVWSEADSTSISRVAGGLPANAIDPKVRGELEKIPTNDTVLARAIANSKRVVVGQTVLTEPGTEVEGVPSTSVATVGDADATTMLEHHEGLLRSLPELEMGSAGRGIFSVSKDVLDGIVRQVPMLLVIKDKIYPSLTLDMLRLKLGAKTVTLKTNAAMGGAESVLIRPPRVKEYFVVNTDLRAQVWVYFRDHKSWEPSYISAVDVIAGRVPPEKLKDKIVLVGSSAKGTFDLRASPLDSVLPGVEMHANILENIIFNQQISRPREALGVEMFALVGIALVMVVVTPMLGAVGGAVFFGAVAAAWLGYSWNEFSANRQLYDPTFPVAVAFMFYSWLTYVGFLNTERSKKQVRSAFGQYLSPALVEQLADDPSRLTLGGENRDMTFMFSDIRGFSGISELFDAQGLTRLINRLLTPLTDSILRTNGTIDKYMGDCVMAFWNAPLDVPRHAVQACRSALAMIEDVARVNAEVEAEAKAEGREHRPLAVGIGVNSGIACVGNMGSEQRFGYSVLGDNVNLASRLEGQSKTYHLTIVLGEATALGAPEFPILELDLIQVKGKTQAVRIFTLLGDETVARQPWFAELKQHHDAMLVAYRAQKWDEAEREIAACRAIVAQQTGLARQIDGFYDVCQERIADFRITPPPADWDGVYVATSK